jgi:hypothetical protein
MWGKDKKAKPDNHNPVQETEMPAQQPADKEKPEMAEANKPEKVEVPVEEQLNTVVECASVTSEFSAALADVKVALNGSDAKKIKAAKTVLKARVILLTEALKEMKAALK